MKKAVWIILAVVILAVVAVLALSMARSGGELSLNAVHSLFVRSRGDVTAEEFSFDSDGKTVYADLDGMFLSCSASAIELYNGAGEQVYLENVLLSSPAVYAAGAYAVVYDLGGTYISLIGKEGRLWNAASEGEIFSATADDSGHVLLCAGESGYKGAVTVFDKTGKALYKWYSGSGYPLKAVMTGSNSLLLLSLGGEGSNLTFLTLDSEQGTSVIVPGEMVIDILPLSGSTFCAVSDTALYTVDVSKMTYESVFDFDGRTLGAYAADEAGAALYLRTYSVGSRGTLITFDSALRQTAQTEITADLLDLDRNGSVWLLYADGLYEYDQRLNLKQTYADAAGAAHVLGRGDGTAAAVFAHSARIFGLE